MTKQREGGTKGRAVIVGDYIVYRSSCGYHLAGPITRVTKALALFESPWGRRERRVSLDDVVFSGAQNDAADLNRKLTSSFAPMQQEISASHDRNQRRVEQYINAATATSEVEHG